MQTVIHFQYEDDIAVLKEKPENYLNILTSSRFRKKKKEITAVFKIKTESVYVNGFIKIILSVIPISIDLKPWLIAFKRISYYKNKSTKIRIMRSNYIKEGGCVLAFLNVENTQKISTSDGSLKSAVSLVLDRYDRVQ